MEYAWLADRRGDFAEGAARWAEVRARFPERSIGYTAGGSSLRSAGRESEAEALLQDAIKRFPDESGAATEFALLAYRRQDWQAADARLQYLRDRFPDARDGYLLGARTLNAAGEARKAVALLQEARQRWPADQDVLITLADLAFDRNDIEESIRLGREIMQQFPGNLTGIFHAVRGLRDSGRPAEAEALLGDDAARTYAGNDAILSVWASLPMTRSDWPEAVRRWQMLRERFPDDAKFSCNAPAPFGA